jgi:uncharacterized protein YbjT (DUF2867 family)
VRIAVLGGSGVLGRLVVDVATSRGLEAVGLSRATGVDLVTGAGLDAALDGCAAAIDASNKVALRRAARSFFETTARHLQATCARAGVAHVVVVSIVGIDRARAYGYYEAKLTQERHHLNGPVDATIVRATQFHEFPEQLAARATLAGRVTLIPALRVQTVAARSVAEILVDAAAGAPWRGRAPDVAGPGPPAELPALATAALGRAGSAARVLAVPLVGPMRRASQDGALLPAADARLVGPTFAGWLDGPDGPARAAPTR